MAKFLEVITVQVIFSSKIAYNINNIFLIKSVQTLFILITNTKDMNKSKHFIEYDNCLNVIKKPLEIPNQTTATGLNEKISSYWRSHQQVQLKMSFRINFVPILCD